MKCPHCQKEIDVREMAHIENYPNTVSARIIHCGRQVFMIDGKQGLWSRMPPDKNNPGEAVMAMMNVGKGGKAHKFFPLPKLDALLRPAQAELKFQAANLALAHRKRFHGHGRAGRAEFGGYVIGGTGFVVCSGQAHTQRLCQISEMPLQICILDVHGVPLPQPSTSSTASSKT